MTAEELWKKFTQETGIEAEYEAWAFGCAPDELAALVLAGTKTATASAYELYAIEGESIPAAGEYSVILDSGNNALCIIKTTEVAVVPYCEVGERQAYLEGEGNRSLAYWRSVHEPFFTECLAEAGLTFDQRTLVVCEVFEVVYTAQQ